MANINFSFKTKMICKFTAFLFFIVATANHIHAQTTTTTCLEPIQDAYLQGTTNFNTTELRVEVGNRVTYLMYDLSNITGTVVSAELKMTVNSDAGTGRITVQKGATNNWTEVNLNTSNSPTAAGALGELTQANFQTNTTYTWPLNGVSLGGNFSMILTQTTGNDVSFRSQEHSNVATRPTLCLTIQQADQTVECAIQFLLEGAYDGQNGMRNNLQNLNLLPSGQPYNIAPWNYNGAEGAGWTAGDYPTGSIDWALISLRTSPLASDEVGKGAVVLLNDGTTHDNISVDVDASISELYLVVEHRSHLPVMTPNPIPIVNGMISYDFTQADSYTNGVGQGQKQIGGNWLLFAANADQNLANGCEITGADNILWLNSNGLPGIYLPEDFNMDGDVTGADRIMWSYNNGIFSTVPKSTITGCFASTIAEVRQCLQSGNNAILTQDITVDNSDCDGYAVLNLNGISDVGIYGQGFKIFRTAGQIQCSMVRGNASTTGFFSDNVVWEEVPGPEVPLVNVYPHMFHFVNSSDICFTGSEVAHSWGYAIYANGVDSFKFKSSTLRSSGALGLYIGHTSNPTTNYEISDNLFIDNTTNAVAVLGGVNGFIDNNIFDNNHLIGIFPVEPQYGTGYTGGGQVYIAMANTLMFSNNTIQNGFCSNCVTAGIFVGPVTGLELGLPNQGTTIYNTTIDNNTIINNTAWGVHLNANATLDLTTQLCNNTITGNGLPLGGIPAANYKP